MPPYLACPSHRPPPRAVEVRPAAGGTAPWRSRGGPSVRRSGAPRIGDALATTATTLLLHPKRRRPMPTGRRLTREAVGLYLDRLAPSGVLALHISNRYFDLEPVVARHQRDHGLAGLVQHTPVSSWVLLS